MDDELTGTQATIGGLIVIFILVFPSLVGYLHTNAHANDSIIRDCQRTHNVYQCKVIAVPVVKDE